MRRKARYVRRRRTAFGGAADRERLEREPGLVDLGEVGDRQLRHAGAAVGDVLD